MKTKQSISFKGESKNVLSRAHQSFKKDSDINNIMTKYKKTGFLVDPSQVRNYSQPMFGDFQDLPDLSSHLNRLKSANDAFQRLPAVTRAKFENNVETALAFIADAKNLKESVELGLLPKELLPTPPVDNSIQPPVDKEVKPAV